MNDQLLELNRQVRHLHANLMTLLSEVALWPTAADCIKLGTYEIDDKLLAARPPLDISAKLDELQRQVEQLNSRRELLEAFGRDNPMPWIEGYATTVRLHSSMPMKDFLNELQRKFKGSLHASIVDLGARCLLDLRLTNTDEGKCVAAQCWHKLLGILTNGDFVWHRLRCEVLAGASQAASIQAPTDEPTERTTAISQSNSKPTRSLDARAIAVFTDNGDPRIKKADIARVLDINPQNLSPDRCPKLHALMQAHQGVSPPRGSKLGNGQIEAADDEFDDDDGE